MERREAKSLILDAIGKSQFTWRTARGIAKDTQVPVEQVVDFLERSERVVRARKPNKRGEVLYTTSDKYRKQTSLSARLVSALTNKVSE